VGSGTSSLRNFFPKGTYDLFLTHGWRYTDSWQALVAAFDEYLAGRWRNWSLPWYDTSIESHTQEGRLQLELLLRGQVSMASAVIVLPEINDRPESRGWLVKELDLAAHYEKPVIGVLAQDGGRFPDELMPQVDEVVRRDPKIIIRAVDRLSNKGSTELIVGTHP